jgi:transposase
MGGEPYQNLMLTMNKQTTIKTLHQQGNKNSLIARLVHCHRHTVENTLKRPAIIEKQIRNKSSMLDSYKQTIEQWKNEDISRLRITEKLRDEYELHVSYINVCKYMQKHFPHPVEAFGVQNTAPGEEAELDFGYLGMLPGKDGRPAKTWGLAVILSYSRVGYYAICYDQKLDTLCAELRQAFSYFGGVPKRLKVDNMKAAVLRNQRYELEFNQDFLEFAQHYTTVIVPCTPYSPEQKGKVESGIKYLQQNFVNGRTFTDSGDIKRKLKDWMTTYANQRTHGTTRKVPWAQLVEKERVALQSLPEEEFALFERCIRKASMNCHIHFDNNYYSVPFPLVGKEVTVRFNAGLVRIVAQGEQVALHARSTGMGEYVTVPAHLPEHKRYSETEHQAASEEKMRAIGEEAHEYFRMLLRAKPGYWKQTVRGILGLLEQYGSEAVNLSLKRATYYQATDVTTIRHILEQKLYAQPLEPVLPKIAEEPGTIGRELTYYTVYDANSLPVTA